MDEDGFLTIFGLLASFTTAHVLTVRAGRGCHVLNTATGELVHPSGLEDQLRMSSLINHAVVFGENRPYLTVRIAM